MPLDPLNVRPLFPALSRRLNGRVVAYLDGPGGTQVPAAVIEAMAGFMAAGGSNHGGSFVTSEETDRVTAAARRAVADLFNGRPDEIVFGQNMTSLTFALSRALSRTWQPGDEIVLSRLDHDANVTPWVLAARDRDVTVHFVDFDPDDGCRLKLEELEMLVGPRTRLVALTHASNAVGTVVNVTRAARIARDAGALLYVDAVHYAPHGPIDVAALGCDLLVASAYKFFGPHTGVLWGRHDLLESLDAYKVRPASDRPPDKWETGTQSFESHAGVTAAVDYLAGLGDDPSGDRPTALRSAMRNIQAYEVGLSRRFLEGAASIPGLEVVGITDERPRTPTFAVSVDGVAPADVSRALGDVGIFTWSGHYYAVEVMQRLGLAESGGLVRIGFVHYNTATEVDRVLTALEAIAAGADPAALPEFAPRTGDLELQPYAAYALTDLPDPRTVNRTRLGTGLLEIVNTEGPITTDRAYQVFVRSSGGKRVTAPVRADLDWALQALVADGKVEVAEYPVVGEERPQRVLRRPGMPAFVPRELGERDLYQVPLSEVAEVMAALRWARADIGEEELKRLTLERYGLKRLTPLASNYLDSARRLVGA